MYRSILITAVSLLPQYLYVPQVENKTYYKDMNSEAE